MERKREPSNRVTPLSPAGTAGRGDSETATTRHASADIHGGGACTHPAATASATPARPTRTNLTVFFILFS